MTIPLLTVAAIYLYLGLWVWGVVHLEEPPPWFSPLADCWRGWFGGTVPSAWALSIAFCLLVLGIPAFCIMYIGMTLDSLLHP